jgi:hypothetical protein
MKNHKQTRNIGRIKYKDNLEVMKKLSNDNFEYEISDKEKKIVMNCIKEYFKTQHNVILKNDNIKFYFKNNKKEKQKGIQIYNRSCDDNKIILFNGENINWNSLVNYINLNLNNDNFEFYGRSSLMTLDDCIETLLKEQDKEKDNDKFN